MPKAILASRPVKNEETGIDLTVTSFRETKGMVTSTVHYTVVLVSNLACFKTPNHKESDVVQFSIEKKIAEFEQLKTKMTECLGVGIDLPMINKKALIVNEAVLKERRNSLNNLMKFIASTPKTSTCAPLLEFLGIDSVRAQKFSKGESVDGAPLPADITGEDTEQSVTDVNFLQNEEESSAEEEDDFFGKDTDDAASDSNVRMFAEQDMKRDLTEEDEQDFGFIPDAIITKTHTVKTEDEEDNSELFQIDDDLDDLFKKPSPKAELFQNDDDIDEMFKKPSKATSNTPSIDKLHISESDKPKPSISSKPKLSTKPKLAQKPNKDNETSQQEHSDTTPKPQAAAKPQISAKPKPSVKPKQSSKPGIAEKQAAPAKTQSSENDPNLGQDDIMQYLQQNLDQEEDEVDLFS